MTVTILALGIGTATALLPRPGRAQRADVWTLKIALIEKIASFLAWPEEAELDDPDRAFIWTFYGETPLMVRAGELYRERRFQRHPVIVRSARQADEIGRTHVLFVAPSARAQLPLIVARLRNAPVLTVADSPGMAQRGVAVNLYQDEDRIRFEINRSSLRRARIHASFRLLALARLVEEAAP